MGKRVRLTDDSLNSYGSRIVTAGCDVSQYEKNPVLLYMHERGRVIGIMKDIRVGDGEITGEPVFDCATELSRQCKKQWEVGSLRMVSIGIDIHELSDRPEDLVPGQTAPTITKSRVFETSVVDIGANDNAIVMRRGGSQITLGRDSENPLPGLREHKQTQTNNHKEMELKTIALKMGLPETADEASVLAGIDALLAAKAENERLRKEKAELCEKQIGAAVDAAVKEHRLAADKREHFVKLGRQVGLEELRATLEAMSPAMKLSQTIHNDSEGAPAPAKTYAKLSEVPSEELLAMRKDKPEEYRRLYKAEYGMECRI